MKQIQTMIPKDVDLDPDALDADSDPLGIGKSIMLHICPKCGHKFGKEEVA